MRKILFVFLCVVSLLSCQTVTFQGIQAVKAVPAYTVVKDFQKEIGDPHIILNLIALGQPDERIFAYIRDEIEKYSGDAAINVEIDYGLNFFDLILLPVWPIYSGRTITIKGTIVKYTR
jgi:hypothetical protein